MVLTKSTSASPPALPFIIGVTGHRDISVNQIPSLESTVRAFLLDFRRAHPSTPIIILSPLAEGADRLVARVAMALATEGEDILLRVPLPHSEAHYRKDFIEEASKKEFEILLSKAECTFVVDSGEPSLPPLDPTGISEQDLGYVRVGLYVAVHSNLLMAFWDGVINDKPGGTSQVVNYQLNGRHSLIPLHHDRVASMEIGWVLHVATQRESNLAMPVLGYPRLLHGDKIYRLEPGRDGKGFVAYLEGVPREAEPVSGPMPALIRSFFFLDRFNGDLVKLGQGPERSQEAFRSLIPSEDLAHDLSRDPVAHWFLRSDQLAIHYQRKHKLALRWMYSFALLSFSLFNIYSNLLPSRNILALFFLALTILGLGYRVLSLLDHQRRYLDYRALAEGLRVQMYWNLGGVRAEAATHYLSHQVGELDWIRLAIRSAQGTGKQVMEDRASVHMRAIQASWLTGQMDYQLTRAAPRAGAMARRFQIMIMMAFGLGLGLSALIFFIHGRVPMLMSNGLVATVGFLTGLSGILSAYSQKRAYLEQAGRARAMGEVLDWWNKKFDSAMNSSPQERKASLIQDLLFEIGCSLLRENADWVLLYRTRPLELPKG